jgi:DNA-damage-inducible protein D
LKDIVPSQGASPFDALKRTDEHGEYWTARDLMALLAYDQWRRFEEAIDRAQLAAQNAGHDVGQAFCRSRQEGTGGAPRADYRLTRFGAYLVAMNADPRKARVAEAQSYFAVKTREAVAVVRCGVV